MRGAGSLRATGADACRAAYSRSSFNSATPSKSDFSCDGSLGMKAPTCSRTISCVADEAQPASFPPRPQDCHAPITDARPWSGANHARSYALQLHALDHQYQLTPRDPITAIPGVRTRQGENTALETFVVDPEVSALPVKKLQARAARIVEEENLAAYQITTYARRTSPRIASKPLRISVAVRLK